MMNIPHHADDRAPFPIVKPDPLSHRVRGTPELARHRFIDCHNQRPILGVSGLKTTSALDWNSDRCEIAATDRPVFRVIVCSGRLWRAPFYIEGSRIIDAAQWQIRGESGRLHLWNLANAIKQFTLESGDLPMLAHPVLVPVGIPRG